MAKKIMLGKYLIDSAEFNKESGAYLINFSGEKTRVEVLHTFENKLIIKINNLKKTVYYYSDSTGTHVDIDGRSYHLSPQRKSLGGNSSGEEDGQLKSPMPGKVIQVLVNEGQEVKAGDALLVMEAMKMEHTIKAPTDSTVEKVFFAPGDLVDGDVELLSLSSAMKDK